MSLKSTLKHQRSSQPFNRFTTSTLKQLFEIANIRPEFVIKHLPRVGITKIELPDGISLKLDSNGEDWIPTQLFWRGWLGYEPEVTRTFYELAKNARVIFDVGAHVGFFSVLAGTVNPRCDVYAFEPLQRVYEQLERNVSLNDLENVHCVMTAVGNHSGNQEFYFPDQKAPVSSSLRSDMLLATLGETTVRHITVPVETLDSIVRRYGLNEVNLIKLDTERTEDEVLEGSRETLSNFRPDIICEVWPDANNIEQLESLLHEYDYSYYQLLPDGPVKRSHIEPSIDALNYLFSVK